MQKLIEQVTVGAVQFDAVETGPLRVQGSRPEGLDDARDLLAIERTRRNEGRRRTNQTDIAFGGDGARRHGKRSVQEARIGYPAHMPQLQEDSAAGFMHGLRRELPALDLFRRPDTRCVGVADPHRRDHGSLRNDESGGGALGVVLRHQTIGDAAGAGAAARQGRHEDAVRQRQITESEWIE